VPPTCDDSTACTVDQCIAGSGCVHDPVTGPEDLFKIAPVCAGQPVPPSVAQQFAKGCGLVDQAAVETPSKAKKLISKATKALKRAMKSAGKAGRRKKKPISADCAAALRALLGGAQDQAQRLKAGL
jgi:hypothetical protein